MTQKLTVALVGLGFGGAFVPIYVNHPDVERVGLYDTDPEKVNFFAQRYGIKTVYGSFEEILHDETVDAVHLITPIPIHAEQTVQVLQAGKHCACTVPMAIALDDIHSIIRAVNESGKNYMMMETSVYTTHYFHVKEMLEAQKFGRLQFLRGAHYQDMENWPDYWMGLPPMYYGTHAIAPLVMLSGSRIVKTHCFGSGTMREELHARYGNPYPVESALFAFENGLKAEATRSLFETARPYTESFHVYGEKASFEWAQIDAEEPVLFVQGDITPDEKGGYFRGTKCTFERLAPRNYDELLPREIARYTIRSTSYDETNPQISFEEGGGHGGSHPHMVHEFLRSIVEKRKPWINEMIAANITAAGICAHESAMQGGAEILIPDFSV